MFERQKLIFDSISKMQFTIREELPYRILAKFCQITLFVRCIYIETSLLLRLLAGLPILFWGNFTYASFCVFVIWTYILDRHYKYNYSYENFSMKNYFKINFLKLGLFLITIVYIAVCLHKAFDWICSIYAFIMCVLAAGYTMPQFDKILYSDNNND